MHRTQEAADEDEPEDEPPSGMPMDVDGDEQHAPLAGLAPSPAPDALPSPPPASSPPPNPQQDPRIEDVPDEDDPPAHPRATGFERYVEDQHDATRAGEALGFDSTVFEEVQENQEENGETRYGALSNEEVVEVAQFLVECVGKGEADRFLKLARVRTASPHALVLVHPSTSPSPLPVFGPVLNDVLGPR
jgi:hypothetical protein